MGREQPAVISPAFLEGPGRWRGIGLVTGLLVALAPSVSLLSSGLWPFPEVSREFLVPIGRSLAVGAGAALLGLATGLGVGLIAGLYLFPLRRLFLAALALPLVIPSFLWAIGLSSLRIESGLSPDSLLSGASGSVLAFTAFTTPLVALATYLAVSGLSRTQVEAARIAGGERVVLRYALGAALPVSVVVALLGGVLTLSDPGPGQILGFRGAAADILTSFAALYDFGLAARQSAMLALAVLLCGAPVLAYAGGGLAHASMARGPDPVDPIPWGVARRVGPCLCGAVTATILVAPLIGLVLPVLGRFEWRPVLDTVRRTAANTFAYGLWAGLVAAGLGLVLAICAGRNPSLRRLLFAGLVVIFVLPPALGALGTVFVASAAPAWLDPLLRSRSTVGVVLGLRLVPVPAILFVRALGQQPSSWALAAAVHGVPFGRYSFRVLLPCLAPTIGLAVLLVGLLATADVGTVLLLYPPGEDSLPVSIFTVMANAPGMLVAALCLVYVAIAGITVVLGGVAVRVLGRRRPPAGTRPGRTVRR